MNANEIVSSIPDAVIFERPEMVKLLEKLDEIKPKVILEIGTNQGKSAMAFIKAFDPDLFITVDIEDKEKYASVEMKDDRYHYLWGHDSMKSSTIKEVGDMLWLEKKKVDFLWIDGAHFPINVESDFQNYRKFVRKGGVIGFHDIFCESQEDIAVKPYWDMIKKEYKYFEFKTDEPIHLAFPTGFGLIYV